MQPSDNFYADTLFRLLAAEGKSSATAAIEPHKSSVQEQPARHCDENLAEYLI